MIHSLDGSRARTRTTCAALVVALLASLLALFAPAPARAAEVPSSFDPGYIISDASYFDGDAMTASQVQSFLNGRVTTCKATTGPTCLKSFKAASSYTKAADSYCKAFSVAKGASAASIIVAAANACGLSPKVILVMLQKEQGLVSATAPSNWSYQAAMGMNCPDTAPCDSASAGFVNQVYLGARQQQVYAKNPTRYNYVAGQWNTIQWHPSSSCGSSKVYIQNQATANLYIYTPYRPNVAALTAGYGVGDSCSSYGNRNFYNYYVDWFAPEAAASTGAPALVASCTVPSSDEIGYLSGTAKVTTNVTARTAPTNTCGSGAFTLVKNTSFTITGTYGVWTRGTANGKTIWVPTSTITVARTGASASLSGCTVPSSSSVTAAGGIVTVATAALNVRKAPTTSCSSGVIQVSRGSTYARTGIYGAWWRISVNGATYWAHSDYLADTSVERLAGSDRYDTSAAISAASFSSGVGVVYIANGNASADALAAAPVAAAAGAPVLLVRPDRIPDSVAAELKRLKPKRIVVLGGTAVVPENVRKALTTYTSGAVDRLSGADRFETSAKISASTFKPGVDVAYIANGLTSVDALSAAPVAGAGRAPMLLVGPGGLSESVTAELQRLKPKRIVILGGVNAVSKQASNQLRALTGTLSRIQGNTRYDTSAAITEQFSAGVPVLYIANGQSLVDALAAAPVAGMNGAPLLVVASNALPGSVEAEIKRLRPARIVVLGQGQAVSSAVEQRLQQLIVY